MHKLQPLYYNILKKISKVITNPRKCVLAFVIALPARTKRNNEKALKGSDSKLGPILA